MTGIYTPDATDTTRPADNDDASIAAAEMRAIKVRMGTLNTAEAQAAQAAAEAAAIAAASAAASAAAAVALLGANTLIQYCGLAVGTADAIIIAPPTLPTAYKAGQEFTFIAAFTNTSLNPTLQVGLLAPLTSIAPAGTIVAGSSYKVLVAENLTSCTISKFDPVAAVVQSAGDTFVKQFFPSF